MQIRDGLHVFGISPTGQLATELLTQILRTPRGDGDGCNASLLRALAGDLGLDGDGFDPLTAERADLWTGPRPQQLIALSPDVWRSAGDTVERLDTLAGQLVAGQVPPRSQSRD